VKKDVVKCVSVDDTLRMCWVERSVRLIDVRSPIEYEEGHTQTVINVPLFYNTQRSEIGTLYCQVGPEAAMAKGKEAVLPQLDSLVASLEPFRGSPIVVHCQKGGLRSRSLTALLAHSSFDVMQLDGGYRAYRLRMKELWLAKSHPAEFRVSLAPADA
jgi:tRNA 2-selenouridine synthase